MFLSKEIAQLNAVKLIFLQCVISSIFEVVGLSFFTMVAMTSEISAGELIAVMMCVSMVSIMWQMLKTNQREELNNATRKFVSFACGFVQLAGFVVVIAWADVSVVWEFCNSI